MNVAVKFTYLEVPLIASEAERRAMSISEFVRAATLRMVAQPMSTSERDEVIANLIFLNWSAAEIAARLGVSETTIRSRVAAMRRPHV